MTFSRSRRARLAADAVATLVSILLAACAQDDDGGDAGRGGEADSTAALKISGPETGSEADGFTEAFAAFTEESGVEIDYSGSRDFETQIRVAAEGGDL